MDSIGSTLTTGDERPRRGGTSTQPCLFLAFECDRPLALPLRFSLAEVDAVDFGRGRERSGARVVEGAVRKLIVRVPDRWMSASHGQLLRVLGRWVVEDAGSRNGTFLGGAPVGNAPLADGDLFEMGHTFFLFRDAVPTVAEDPPDLDAAQIAPPALGLGTLLPTLARDFAALVPVARSPVAVMIRGESGTGKEVVARALHTLSGRPGPFVAVNCGALPETLVETELFGYRRGAFSGANEDRPGLVRSADRGTLFLDEIGDLPLASQAAFLRVLQEREVTPVGATRPQAVDLRLISATHRDLDELIARERFRADLYARITDFTVALPPLHRRREDLGLLIATLLPRVAAAKGEGISFTVAAARALFRCRWPLNVRELEKCLAAAAVLAQGEPIDLHHLPEAVRAPREIAARAVAPSRSLSEAELRHREELVALLHEHGGNVSAVARVLGKARMQVHRWLRRYGLEIERFRGD